MFEYLNKQIHISSRYAMKVCFVGEDVVFLLQLIIVMSTKFNSTMSKQRQWDVPPSKIQEQLNGRYLRSSKKVINLDARFFVEENLYKPGYYNLVQVFNGEKDVLLTAQNSFKTTFLKGTFLKRVGIKTRSFRKPFFIERFQRGRLVF